MINKPVNQLQFSTEVRAKFESLYRIEVPEAQASLDALNKHAEEICEALQPVFRSLIITMLELKRQTHT